MLQYESKSEQNKSMTTFRITLIEPSTTSIIGTNAPLQMEKRKEKKKKKWTCENWEHEKWEKVKLRKWVGKMRKKLKRKHFLDVPNGIVLDRDGLLSLRFRDAKHNQICQSSWIIKELQTWKTRTIISVEILLPS